MPAERNQRRADQEDNHFVWSLEPTNSDAYTQDLSDLPPLVDTPPPSEFILFSPTDDTPSSPRKQPHTKKKPENHIPRPPNAFILFRSSFIKSQAVSTEVETNHSTLSKIIGLTWQNLPDSERKVWHTKAKEALEEHRKKFPKYAFRPTQTKAKGGSGAEKRKVREVEPKDPTRCAKIAQLLVEGKKGHELDIAIQEFDKTHVPTIVARFEAPITARSYRRSSSAPVPDTKHSRANQSFFHVFKGSPPSTPRKSKSQRSLSVRPTPSSVPPTPSLKREPSFDFSTFSFDSSVTSSPTMGPHFDTCDPLSLPAGTSPFDQCQSIIDSYTSNHNLSIDTTFPNTWANSPSPTYDAFSPFNSHPLDEETPLPSPTYDTFTPFTDTFSTMEKPLFDYSQFPIYHHHQGLGESQLMSHADFDASQFALQHIPIAELDLDFGFLAGQY
ncbi:hypothetical protein BDQ17DRAFT_1371560 [Cyathus striatus]|nr:hypothetical protein BDQ17DRAFT_1371560 [Cyathus striatus]